MTAKSSRTIPFIVLGIVVVTLVAEEAFNMKINLEDYLPLLVALGIGGAAKSAIVKAAGAKSELDKLKIYDNVKKKLKEEKLI